MKLNPSTLAAALLASLSTAVHAADQTWNSSGPTDNWNTSDLNWDAGAGWTQGNNTIFGGTGETVTLTQGISVGNMTFSSSGYLISGNTLTLGTASVITTAADATLSSILTSGTNAVLTKEGSGTLTLTGVNTLGNANRADVTINGGTLKVTGTGVLFSNNAVATSVVTINPGATLEVDRWAWGANTSFGKQNFANGNLVFNGGTLRYSGADNVSETNNGRGFTIGVNGATLESAASSGGTWRIPGSITSSAGGTLTLKGNSNGRLDGALGGTGGLTKSGSGMWTLTTNSSYTGATTINAGTLNINNTVRNTSSISVGSGATANINSTNFLTAGHGTAVADSRVLAADGGTLTFSAAMEARIGNVTLNNAATFTTNRGFTGYDLLLGDTTSGQATVSVGGTGTSLINGSGGLHLLGSQKFNVASGATLNISATLGNSGSQGANAAGGINKLGAGTLVLAGTNTYTGVTSVNAGILSLTGSASVQSSSIIVSGGALFDVSGLSAPFNLAAAQTLVAGRTSGTGSDVKGNFTSQGTLRIGGSGNTAGTLTEEGNLTLDSSVVRYDLANTHTVGAGVNDLIQIQGDLTLNGINEINVTPLNTALASGTYTLLTCSGTLTGDETNLVLTGVTSAGRQSLALAKSGSSIVLQVSGLPANLVWKGDAAGAPTTWDINNTANWTGIADGKYMDGDFVLFDDTATSFTVDLTDFASPSSVTFNSSANYTLNAGEFGDISGQTGITKNGSGTLTIAGDYPLTFTGGMSVNQGVVSVTTPGLLGNGFITLGSNTTAGTVAITGATVSVQSHPITVNPAGGSLEITAVDSTISQSGTVTLNGSLTKSGEGTLTLTSTCSGIGGITQSGGTMIATGNQSYSGATVVNSGKLVLAGSAHTQRIATASNISVNNGGTFEIGATNSINQNKFTINAGGVLNMAAGQTAWMQGGLTLEGGTLASTDGGYGGYTFMLSPNGVNPAKIDILGDVTSTISAQNVGLLQNGTLEFNVADGASATDLIVTGNFKNNGTSGLNKTGAGTMVLAGANTYTGATAVNAGSLAVLGTLGATAVTVASGATLDAGSNLSGMAAMGSSVQVNSGGHLTFHIAANPASQVTRTLTGTLTLAAGNVLDLTAAATPADGTYTLATAATITGTPGVGTTLTLAPGRTATLSVSGTSLVLTVGSGGYDSWNDQITNGRNLRNEDADDDGFTNLQEFLFGTDPMSGTSTLSTTETVGGDFIIRWKERTSGASYKLMESATLSNPWIQSGATITADGAQVGDYIPRKAVIAIGPNKNFFRVEGVEN